MNEKQQTNGYSIPETFKAEALDQLTYLLWDTGEQLIHFVITFDGQLDFETLQKAMRISFDIEPILGCKFVDHPKKPYWQRFENIDQKEFCTLIKTMDFDSSLHDFVTRDYDLTDELPIQAGLFRLEKNDVLCLKVLHMACDGGGIFEYIQLLNSIYTKLVEKISIEIKPNLGRRSLVQVLKKIKYFRRVRAFLKNMSPKPTWAFPWKDTKRTKRNFIIRKISEERFDQIKEYGKQRGATINDLLLTAFYRAMYKVVSPKQGRKMVTVVTVNLRNYIKNRKAEAISNLSTSTYPYIPWNENEEFDETLQLIQKEMKKFKETLPGIGPAFFMHNLFKRLKFSRVKKVIQERIQKDLETQTTHPVFTNVGLVKAEQITIGRVKATDGYLITPITFAPGFIFGTSTFEKKMSFSLGYCEGSYSNELIEQFLDGFLRELPANQ